ncbi:hypothetical protein N7519_007946 [Penicillium mononematosum]|uniref:uncharacterized protein n=1 Tax=Penicillium mononematosum TaxID=268346 RepID=UPI002546895A|nr:uncharacterized protein N7519_007946 [Penicillium mononematosum]KAJ6186645.1 hypothetical protein N7519_007946 [Penicillium mononematosum]
MASDCNSKARNPLNFNHGPHSHSRRWSYLTLANEAAARCIINSILFSLLDTVVPYPNNGQWPLNLQMETSLTSRPFPLRGKVYQAKGTYDYTLWYGERGGADKAINLVLVEAKKLGLASQGDDQALGYMACVHQERRTLPSRNSTVCGLSTDGEEFRFLRINERSEFSKAIMMKTPPWELFSHHEHDCFYHEGGGFPVALHVQEF